MNLLNSYWSRHSDTETAAFDAAERLCGCGCGEPAVEGVEMHALLLAAAKQSLNQLKAKAKSGGERSRRAENLLWAWQRCEKGFEAYVHGAQLDECGPPTPLWVNSWRRRVKEL